MNLCILAYVTAKLISVKLEAEEIVPEIYVYVYLLVFVLVLHAYTCDIQWHGGYWMLRFLSISFAKDFDGKILVIFCAVEKSRNMRSCRSVPRIYIFIISIILYQRREFAHRKTLSYNEKSILCNTIVINYFFAIKISYKR